CYGASPSSRTKRRCRSSTSGAASCATARA
ncbi:MAG: hypothetical protein AVDCRST_MAG42-606, partial [uncultured Chthoniobacterales bacterium]